MNELLEKARAVHKRVIAGYTRRAKGSPDPDFSELSTKYVFGEIWSRPGLTLEERRLIVLSMLIALNRPNEFKIHVGCAISDGMDRAKIKEIMLQSMVYCGVPAALDFFHVANEVYEEFNKK
jgi:alkylhydroperoxidase/carboxymuconolactone decarboxylase family protein YurZ